MFILQCILANMPPIPRKPCGKTTDCHTETQQYCNRTGNITIFHWSYHCFAYGIFQFSWRPKRPVSVDLTIIRRQQWQQSIMQYQGDHMIWF